MFIYLSGTFGMRQHGGFWHFSWVFETWIRCAKISFLWGGGGLCVYFLESVRKGGFRIVWVGGGGRWSLFGAQSCKLDDAQDGAMLEGPLIILNPNACMQVAGTGCTSLFCPAARLMHLHQPQTPGARSFALQRLLWCIGGSNSTWCKFVCRHGSCLLTKRGNKEQGHRPKRTKVSYMSSVQHADLGCSK